MQRNGEAKFSDTDERTARLEFVFFLIQHTLYEEIVKSHKTYSRFTKIKEPIKEDKAKGFMIHEDVILQLKGRWCVPESYEDIKEKIMKEVHYSPIGEKKTVLRP